MCILGLRCHYFAAFAATCCLQLAPTVQTQTPPEPIVYLDSAVSPREATSKASKDIIARYTSNKDQPTGLLRKDDFKLFLAEATLHSTGYVEKLLGPCGDAGQNCSWKYECPGVDEIYSQYATNEQYLDADGFQLALPVALDTLTTPKCSRGAEDFVLHGKHKKKPTTAQTWGYGIGLVSVVVFVISNVGACLGPVMHKKFFQRLLQFLVAMGAGSLAATGLLVLIPEAFNIMSVKELGEDYIWKSTVAVFSIFVFFGSERLLKTFLYRGNKSKSPKSQDDFMALNSDKEDHGHSHGPPEGSSLHERKTLAWMVMAGDGIHNFVDGLAIGAAFSEDIALGISVCLAVFCEELPHELADIAILLHAGYSIWRAVLINFLSACVCYVGLVVGISLGTIIADGTRWIFALAGGLFLYVPLVDMLPDMSKHLDSTLKKSKREAIIVAFLQMLGLVVGALIIVVIVHVSECIIVE